jgi:hypothetical protein
MSEFLFDPPLQLPGNVTVRTLDDAAAFTRNYKTPRQPLIRDGVLHRLEGASNPEEERNAANAFRAWVEEEGIPTPVRNDGEVSS